MNHSGEYERSPGATHHTPQSHLGQPLHELRIALLRVFPRRLFVQLQVLIFALVRPLVMPVRVWYHFVQESRKHLHSWILFHVFEPCCFNLSGIHLQCISLCRRLFLSTIQYPLAFSAFQIQNTTGQKEHMCNDTTSCYSKVCLDVAAAAPEVDIPQLLVLLLQQILTSSSTTCWLVASPSLA